MKIRSVSAAAALASLLSAAGAAAQTELFISEYEFNRAQMSAVRTDGTLPRTMFTLPSSLWLPIGLTYVPSTGKLFWMDSAGSSDVMTSSVTGGSMTTLATVPGFCKGVSRDAQGRIYFGSNNTVQRINADGSGRVVLYTSPVSDPVGAPRVDATNGHVYFGADGEIRRMNLDGTNLKSLIRGISQGRSISLDIASRHIYWSDADTISDYIGRANLDGSGFRVHIDASPSVVQSSGLIDMTVDAAGGFIFYADDLVDRVYRADINGAGSQVIFSSAEDQSPSGLVLSTGEPVQALNDCDGNGIADDLDIASGAPDCDNNGVPDGCQARPCYQPTLLLDQGSNSLESSGKAVGQPSGWQVFQPFDVPAQGWDVGAVGIDGFNVNYHNGTGMIVTIFPDNGADRPDETSPIASASGLNLRFNTFYVNWQYIDLRAQLPAGRYWLQLKASEPAVYQASITFGFSGLGSYNRGNSGNFLGPGTPIALRIVEAEPCPSDFNNDGFVNGDDFDEFVAAFELGDIEADFDGNGFVNGDDYDGFVVVFEQGC